MSFLRRSSSSAVAAAAGNATGVAASATPSAMSSRRNSSSSPTPSVTTGAKSTMSALHQYLATFAKGLPKIDKTSGVLCTFAKGTSGKESAMARTWHSTPKLEDFGIGTSRPIIVIPPPRERALAKGHELAQIQNGGGVGYMAPVTSMQPWFGRPARSQPRRMQMISYSKKPAPAKKPRISLPDGYDDPNRVDSWNSRELERIIYEFGGVQRGNVETKRNELRQLLAKYQKRPPSSSKS